MSIYSHKSLKPILNYRSQNSDCLCWRCSNCSRGWSGFEADGSAKGVLDGLVGCDAVEAGGSDDGSGEGVNVGAPEGPEAGGGLSGDDAGSERAFGAVVGGG